MSDRPTGVHGRKQAEPLRLEDLLDKTRYVHVCSFCFLLSIQIQFTSSEATTDDILYSIFIYSQSMDYEVDSDDEWEEEENAENISASEVCEVGLGFVCF